MSYISSYRKDGFLIDRHYFEGIIIDLVANNSYQREIDSSILEIVSQSIMDGSPRCFNWEIDVKNLTRNSKFYDLDFIKNNLLNTCEAKITQDLLYALDDYLDDFISFQDSYKDGVEMDIRLHNVLMKNSKVRKKESLGALKKIWTKNNPVKNFQSWIHSFLKFIAVYPRYKKLFQQVN